MRRVKVLALVMCILGLGTFLFGQTGTSSIRGTVTDQQGRVISDAIVTLTNTATNSARTTKTGEAGTYVFEFLVPANYRIEVDAKGFRKGQVDNVKALISKATEASVQLEVGASTEVVEVQASARDAVVNTQDATLGNVFESTQITQLPLEARNLIDLLSLQPGVSREGYTTGARADQSNVTLDGVDINNAQSGNTTITPGNGASPIGGIDTDRGNITSGPVLRLNSEAIEEFRVTTANGNADQGRSSGGQINMLTRSGTNTWHGAAFDSYRTRGFEANDWFSNHDGVPRTALQRNTFGGGIGGPIVKNKVFFFYSFEGRRDSSGTSQVQVVPLNGTQLFGDGDLGTGLIHYSYPVPTGGCPGASVQSGCVGALDLTQTQQVYSWTGVNPDATAALAAAIAKYPANDSSVGDGLNTGGFRFNALTPIKLNSHTLKLDFKLTGKQDAFVRLNYQSDHQTLTQYVPDAPPPTVWSHPSGFAVGHTWTIGNNWVNNLRYGYTRLAFSQLGDSTGNDIQFRNVFQPNSETHNVSRVSPVHNITDDVSWIHGNHNLELGANVRIISNSRVSFANAFDFGITNSSGYSTGGTSVSGAFQSFLNANNLPGCDPDSAGTLCPNSSGAMNSPTSVQDAGTAIIGRLSQYNANFTFAKDGSLLSSGTPSTRDFATQAYDMYVQDSWKVQHNLTLTLGLRYSLERPVYEKQGFQVGTGLSDSSGGCTPTSMSTYFSERQAAALQGNNFTTPICVSLAGPANGGKPMYNWDHHEFQPRVAFAWTPDGGDGFFGRLLGHGGASVFRGGFAITNDNYGQALAVDFDLNNTLGFTASDQIPVNTYGTQTGNPKAPLFTGFDMDIRSLPNISTPANLQFPLAQDPDFGEQIQSSIDSKLTAPINYVWNFTFERQLPKQGVLTFSYVGRVAHNLLAQQDVTAFNNVVDPQSKMNWYTAGTMLEKQRQLGVPIDQIQPIPFFENLFPTGANSLANLNNAAFGGGWDPNWSNTQAFYAFNSSISNPGATSPTAFFTANDWTDTQGIVDQVMDAFGFPTRFMAPQYGDLSVWSTVAHSNYNALAVSWRQRLHGLLMDVNYTLSHSLDNASGLQGELQFATASFIENPLRPESFYGNSSFDVRHNINADAVWQLPVGRGQAFLGNSGKLAQAFVGGWQISGIFRWNSGLPITSPFDSAQWATNFNVQANVTPLGPVHTCPSRPQVGSPKIFGSCDETAIYQNFRSAYPGETGPRNYLRYPGYVDTDLGIAKTFNMPYNEKHVLQLRIDGFNITNTQHFGNADTVTRTGFGVLPDAKLTDATPPSNWSNFTAIQGSPRVLQVSARYSF
jgi:hypothetical protein